MSSKWYYIGGNSLFDEEMHFVEMAMRYDKPESPDDINALYFYYRSAISEYWSKFRHLLSVTNPALSPEDRQKKYDEYIASYKQEFVLAAIEVYEQAVKITQEDVAMAENMYNRALTRITDLYRMTLEDKNRRYDLVFEILVFVRMLGVLLCGNSGREMYDKDGDPLPSFRRGMDRLDSKTRRYPLMNNTGWFHYNTYMYGLINGIQIVGVPSDISSFDGNINCPRRFIDHDDTHIGQMNRFCNYDGLAALYEKIMRGNFTVNEKELIIFSIWFTFHEYSAISEVGIYELDLIYLNSIDDIFNINVDYGIAITQDTIEEIRKIYISEKRVQKIAGTIKVDVNVLKSSTYTYTGTIQAKERRRLRDLLEDYFGMVNNGMIKRNDDQSNDNTFLFYMAMMYGLYTIRKM